jgi:hypothetical protein
MLLRHIFVVNYGNVDGVHRFRVHGTMKELLTVIEGTLLVGHRFVTKPVIEHVRKNEYTMWVELDIPLEPVAVENCV